MKHKVTPPHLQGQKDIGKNLKAFEIDYICTLNLCENIKLRFKAKGFAVVVDKADEKATRWKCEQSTGGENILHLKEKKKATEKCLF